MIMTEVKEKLCDKSLLALLSHCQYQPTADKLSALADTYQKDDGIFVFACMEREVPCGIIALKHLADASYEILAIATDPSCRHKGMGSKLIAYAAETRHCIKLYAETDGDAVGFYQKYGFTIQSLGEKYPGIIRYLCILEHPPAM